MPRSRSRGRSSDRLPFKGLFDLEKYVSTDQNSKIDVKSIEENTIVNAMVVLEEIRRHEQDLYEFDSAYRNILSYLYIRQNKSEQALQLINEALEDDPNSIIALCNLYEYLHQREKNKEKRRCVGHIKSLLSDSGNMSIAEGEVAFYLSILDFRLYFLSMKMFEHVCACMEKAMKDQKKFAWWKYNLTSLYRKILLTDVFQERSHLCPHAIFHKLKDAALFPGIEKHKLLHGKCLINMADGFRKYEVIVFGEDEIIKLPRGWTAQNWYEEAYKKCSNDPHVLEKYGIFLRKQSTAKKELLKAAGMLETVIRICPGRHVALHHLALTYKSLWWFEQELPQRSLLNNKIKKGKVKKTPGLSKSARRRQNKKEHAPENELRSVWVDNEQMMEMACTSHNSLSNFQIQRAVERLPVAAKSNKGKKSKARVQTIPPNHPNKLREVPEQFTKISYFDALKVQNPRGDPSKSHFLNKAKLTLEKANILVGEKVMIYLLDLARICISLGYNEKAEDYFRKANAIKVYKSQVDRASLYEQWAIFKNIHGYESDTESIHSDDVNGLMDYLDDDDPEPMPGLSDAECLFLKSIQMSIMSKTKSKVSYFYLRDILENEFLNCESQQRVTKWSLARLIILAWIYQKVGKTENAERILSLLKNHNTINGPWLIQIEVGCLAAFGAHSQAVETIVKSAYSTVIPPIQIVRLVYDGISNAVDDDTIEINDIEDQFKQYKEVHNLLYKFVEDSVEGQLQQMCFTEDSDEEETIVKSQVKPKPEYDIVLVCNYFDYRNWVYALYTVLKKVHSVFFACADEDIPSDLTNEQDLVDVAEDGTSLILLCFTSAEESKPLSRLQRFYDASIDVGREKCSLGVFKLKDDGIQVDQTFMMKCVDSVDISNVQCILQDGLEDNPSDKLAKLNKLKQENEVLYTVWNAVASTLEYKE